MGKSPMKLEITQKDGGYQIKLDETVIHHVEHYSIDQASAPGKAVLTLKVLVEYPVNEKVTDRMQIFEALRCITKAKEYSRIVYALSRKAGSPEELEKLLLEVIPEEQLQTLRSVAQRGNYPISFDGMQ